MLSVAMKAGSGLPLNDEQCPQSVLFVETWEHPAFVPVVVYARVSPGHRQCPPSDQLDVAREHAKRLGLEIIKVFQDSKPADENLFA